MHLHGNLLRRKLREFAKLFAVPDTRQHLLRLFFMFLLTNLLRSGFLRFLAELLTMSDARR